jgi:hypothetical protein
VLSRRYIHFAIGGLETDANSEVEELEELVGNMPEFPDEKTSP